jgi:hypothetical protein
MDYLLSTATGNPIVQLALSIGSDACGSRRSNYVDFVFDPRGCPQPFLYLLRRQVKVSANEEGVPDLKSMSHNAI